MAICTVALHSAHLFPRCCDSQIMLRCVIEEYTNVTKEKHTPAPSLRHVYTVIEKF